MWRNSLRIFVLLWIARLLIESRTTRAFRSGCPRMRNSTFSMMFSSIVGLSTMIAWGVPLRLGHHDLADAVDEPDVVHRDLEDLQGVDDALARDGRGDVDHLEVLLHRESVEHPLDRVEVLVRFEVQRDRGRVRQRAELLRDLARDAHLNRHWPRSLL